MSVISCSFLSRRIIRSNLHIVAALFLVLVCFIPASTVKADKGPIPDWNLVDNSPFDLISPPGVTNPVIKASDVTDVSAQFVADPFLFHENNQWHMFFEVLNTGTNRGEIGVAASHDGLTWTYDRIVLAEKFHLSYPFVFKYQDQYYMMPETYQISEVRLYKAYNFPYDWRYATTLVKGRRLC